MCRVENCALNGDSDFDCKLLNVSDIGFAQVIFDEVCNCFPTFEELRIARIPHVPQTSCTVSFVSCVIRRFIGKTRGCNECEIYETRQSEGNAKDIIARAVKRRSPEPPPELACFCGSKQKLTKCGSQFICLSCCTQKKCFSFPVCPRQQSEEIYKSHRPRAMDLKVYNILEAQRNDRLNAEPEETVTQMTIEELENKRRNKL